MPPVVTGKMAEAYIETDVDSDTESEKSEETNANAKVICKGCNVGWEQLLREAPFNKVPPLCGHCPNSNTLPPALKRALFFRRDLTILKGF